VIENGYRKTLTLVFIQSLIWALVGPWVYFSRQALQKGSPSEMASIFVGGPLKRSASVSRF
jgi:hypothetical protein